MFVAPCQLHCNKSAAAPPDRTQARPPPAVADMESVASNIQVLLQAAEFLERRERGEAEPLAGPLAGPQAATLLTRAWVRLGSQLGGCIPGFNAVAPGHPRLKMERSPRSVGLAGVGDVVLPPKARPDGAVPGAPAGTSSSLTPTRALSGRG